MLLRADAPMRLGSVAGVVSVAEIATYSQTISSLERLHKLGRVLRHGPPKSSLWEIAPGVRAAIKDVAKKARPTLGDMCFGLQNRPDHGAILYGKLVRIVQAFGYNNSYSIAVTDDLDHECGAVDFSCEPLGEIVKQERIKMDGA